MAPRNLDRLTQVYGPTTWAVYDRLDVSLDPAGPDQLHDHVEANLHWEVFQLLGKLAPVVHVLARA